LIVRLDDSLQKCVIHSLKLVEIDLAQLG